MKIHHIAAIAAASSLLAGCGGSGDSGDSGGPPAGATTYPQVTPTLGSLDTFTTSNVDDSNNTVNESYEERVTAVNSDGSYQLTQDDPGNQTVTVNGITYHDDPTVRQYAGPAGNGGQTSYVVTLPSGVVESCSYAVQGGARKRPLYVGETWMIHYTVTCGSSTTAYVETGAIASVESVTVPAGTFTALKETETISWKTASGENVVETNTGWIDPAHAFFTIKRVIAYQRSGSVPAHYVTGETILLQSRS